MSDFIWVLIAVGGGLLVAFMATRLCQLGKDNRNGTSKMAR